ncbi:MAG: hypothetical protein ACRDYC_04275 [Acidimicrobiales bacterium]
MTRLHGVHAVHIHGLPNPGPVLALLIAASLRLPALVSDHRGPLTHARGGARIVESTAVRATAQLVP